ncbi:PPOX class F420-dependent oxidoreductase [Nocardioides anomalus]|uniref:PPOX class F420-dependent oxidoreductase n=1 Tax=Nocardioides anomalus TaxID=2712223 RepID=A0A6G6W9F4_9ACTN|nr:PPOX class F420-dependent oxidoreductase [Nocardioides anomalus]QIG41981.1 PPOX class F420-dependent oxidoreductase [Nocardioides anomalus]
MELEQALAAARRNHQSVLVTIRSSDGRPQLSNVLHRVTDDGDVQVSITTSRAKYKNLQRTPWAALHLNGEDFWSYVVLEGEATLSDVARDPHDAVVEELVDYYRELSGEHPDWDDYRAAQVREERVLVRLRPSRAYGLLR